MKGYLILSYVLLPIAFFFGFLDLIILISSLANPSALILVFVLACFVIYALTSFKFFKYGVQKEQSMSFKLRDWIKVNAFVSLFLCSLFFINSISIILSKDAALLVFIDEFLGQQTGLPKELTNIFILQILRTLSYFLLLTGTIGLIHIRMTLRMLRTFDYLFENN